LIDKKRLLLYYCIVVIGRNKMFFYLSNKSYNKIHKIDLKGYLSAN